MPEGLTPHSFHMSSGFSLSTAGGLSFIVFPTTYEQASIARCSNASLWYAVWNDYGKENYAGTDASRCRCSDPTSAMPSQLVDEPGYHTYSLAGPHSGLRPYHKIDGFDLEVR